MVGAARGRSCAERGGDPAAGLARTMLRLLQYACGRIPTQRGRLRREEPVCERRRRQRGQQRGQDRRRGEERAVAHHPILFGRHQGKVFAADHWSRRSDRKRRRLLLCSTALQKQQGRRD